MEEKNFCSPSGIRIDAFLFKSRTPTVTLSTCSNREDNFVPWVRIRIVLWHQKSNENSSSRLVVRLSRRYTPVSAAKSGDEKSVKRNEWCNDSLIFSHSRIHNKHYNLLLLLLLFVLLLLCCKYVVGLMNEFYYDLLFFLLRTRNYMNEFGMLCDVMDYRRLKIWFEYNFFFFFDCVHVLRPATCNERSATDIA